MTTRRANGLGWTTHSLSVLVPAFNEEGNLEGTVDRLVRALNTSVEDFEIIVVNDGSSDGTRDVANRLSKQYEQLRVFHNDRNMGLGYCYALGISAATKASFVYIPGDNTWPYRSFVELVGNLGKADIVTSYSTNPDVRSGVRRVVSALYTRVLNVLFGHRMQYYNGLTIYPISFLKSIRITTYGFGFQAETLLRALRRGLSFIEVALPIDERMAGRSKAVSAANIASVVKTICHMYWELRVRGGGGGVATQTSQQPVANAKETMRRSLRIIVTGASSGIGAALVSALAAENHRLFVCSRRWETLEKVIAAHAGVRGRACDVSDEAHVASFVGWVKSQTPEVDAVINCAGGFGAIGPVDETESEAWLDTIRVNLFGTYLMIRHTLPLLRDAESPRIINFSGGGAFGPFPNYSAYASAKAGVVRLTECLSAELAAQGIAVNAVAPGFVATAAHNATLQAGAERAGVLHYRRTKAILEDGGVRLGNVVDCVRMLLSDAAQGLTGKTISANFDPWKTEAFRTRLPDITRSDLYTMRRLNIVNLPEGSLRSTLARAWAGHGAQS